MSLICDRVPRGTRNYAQYVEHHSKVREEKDCANLPTSSCAAGSTHYYTFTSSGLLRIRVARMRCQFHTNAPAGFRRHTVTTEPTAAYNLNCMRAPSERPNLSSPQRQLTSTCCDSARVLCMAVHTDSGEHNTLCVTLSHPSSFAFASALLNS